MRNDVNFFYIGEIADIRAGYPFRVGIDPVAHGATRVVQMRDIELNGHINWVETTRTELSRRKAPDWLTVGDLLLVVRGTRYYAACLETVPAPAVCGPHLFHLRAKPSAAVVPEFLAWQINQAPLQRELRKAAEGSSQLSIRRPVLESLRICLPSLPAQERIVRLARLASRERDLLTSLIRNRERELGALANALSISASGSVDQAINPQEPRP